jgi:hypothetical protein
MSLDPGKNYFDGPIAIALYSEPDAEGVRTLLGYKPGCHVNATPLGWAALDLTAYLLDPQPETPSQVYAGGQTYCLWFATESAAKAVLADYWIDDAA